MSRRRNSLGVLKWDSLPDPGPRYQLGERIGSGVCADVYEAQDLQTNESVAVKIQTINEENMEDLEEEFNVLQKLSQHKNLPTFYGAFRKKSRDSDQLWFVMELCQGGSMIDLARAVDKNGKKLSESTLGYVLKEVVKAVMFMHENHVMHRDIRGSNILLTKDAGVRLVDFNLSRELKSTMGKRGTSVGSPGWMAPELVTSEQKAGSQDVYDNRVDVWALGITAIELADAKAPYEDIHPTRALFQIVRNPPPALFRQSCWSQNFNDFINETLVKNPEHRPVMAEMIEHPFFESIPDNAPHLMKELKLIMSSAQKNKSEPNQEMLVRSNFLKVDQSSESEPMYLEDLCGMEHPTEDAILEMLQQRLKRGSSYTYLGDVLLFLNPNENQENLFTDEVRRKYCCKSRSDNVPHAYSVADCAYQDTLHHEEPQHIIISGESLSGKTANMMHMLRHLLYVGKGNVAVGHRILSSMTILHAMGNACTPLNGNSTRHVLHTNVTFTSTGKVSGAIFYLYQLERWRVTTDDKRQGNFHLFYYFYDAMVARKQLEKYSLEGGRRHRYLRPVGPPSGGVPAGGVSSDPAAATSNLRSFEDFEAALGALEFSTGEQDTIKNIMAAIIILGDVRFRDCGDGKAEIENPRVSTSVATLLGVDDKKLSWAMVNYCVIERGQAEKRRQTPEEAEEARDALARAMYSRLVDWIINKINLKLSFTRAVFGDKHKVTILDLFGFECFQKNTLEQLFVNSLNEQLQYHYTQRLFAWEMQEREEEDVRNAERLTYYNNRATVDLLMGKPEGVMWLVDEATRTTQGAPYIINALKKNKSPYCQISANENEFSVAHYTGKVTYDARALHEANKDFVPPEVTETLRLSSDVIVKEMFTNPLTRSGNLTQADIDVQAAEASVLTVNPGPRRTSKWSAALLSDKTQKSNNNYNTLSRGRFSQTRRMRTASAMFRATCLELLRALNTGGTHFLRCVRSELTGQPRGFQSEVVRQQLRALGILDTVRARQSGFPYRVPFSEFLRRYKFLAFDFDETVDETADNCRLMMVRLKMEGYTMGKTKMFLKYYNEEYLARLYEIQVKKIIKVQAMFRSFLIKKRVDNAAAGDKKPGSLANANLGTSIDDAKPVEAQPPKAAPAKDPPPKSSAPVKKAADMKEDEAAILIQKPSSSEYDNQTYLMMRYYCRRWKARSVFQVLLYYRAARQQDLVYFSQQAHLYNQGAVSELQTSEKKRIAMTEIREVNRREAGRLLGDKPANVMKRPFRFDKIPYFDTTPMCDPVTAGLDSMYAGDDGMQPGDVDTWDAPLRRKKSMLRKNRANKRVKDQEVQTGTGVTLGGSDGPSANVAHIQAPFKRELVDPVSNIKRARSPRRPTPSSNTAQSNSSSKTTYVQQSWADKQQATNNNAKPGRDNARPTGHIRELEARGKEMATSDEAPFNFQGMLRKTNYNRGSMKRVSIYSPDDNNGPSTRRDVPQFSVTSYGDKKSTDWERNEFGPEPNSQFRPNSYSAAVKNESSSNRNESFNKSTSFELAPGVILEGDVADL